MLSIILIIISIALIIAILVYAFQEVKTIKLVNERQDIIDSLILMDIEFKYDLKVTNIKYLN